MRKTSAVPNPFVGRWRITHMDQWAQNFVDAEVEGYVEFTAGRSGRFQFGYVQGGMDCRLTTRDGQPAWSGHGMGTTKWIRRGDGAGRSSRATSCMG